MTDKNGNPTPGEYITEDIREIQILRNSGYKYEDMEEKTMQIERDNKLDEKIKAMKLDEIPEQKDDPKNLSKKQLHEALKEVNADFKKSATVIELIEIYNKEVLGK
jgi:hypothetical protein